MNIEYHNSPPIVLAIELDTYISGRGLTPFEALIDLYDYIIRSYEILRQAKKKYLFNKQLEEDLSSLQSLMEDISYIDCNKYL